MAAGCGHAANATFEEKLSQRSMLESKWAERIHGMAETKPHAHHTVISAIGFQLKLTLPHPELQVIVWDEELIELSQT